MFASVDDIAPLVLMEGIRARPVHGDQITLAIVELSPGIRMPEHRHPNEQVGVVLRGEFTFTVGGETQVRRPGDMWVIPPDVPHTVEATATGAHVAVATAAVDAHIPVVVEKPMAVTANGARRLVEHAARRDVLLVPFLNRRWDSDHLTVSGLLAENALGTVFSYESRFERWRPSPNEASWREQLPPESGGGVLLDLGVHLVDQALSLFGPVRHVYAEVRAHRGGADDDVFLALHHESGVRSHLWASSLAAARGPRLRVLGSEAAYVVDHLDGQEEALRAGGRPDQPGFGEEPAERWGRMVRGDVSEPVPSIAG